MSSSSLRNRAKLRRIIVGALIAALILISGVMALIGYSAHAIDQVATEQETELVTRRFERALLAMKDNVISATVWNDAEDAMTARDLPWAQLNFGDYYADYMKHEITVAYAADGDLIYASRDSEPVATTAERAFAQAVAPLVADVRQEGAARKRNAPRAVGLDAVSTRQAIVAVDGVLHLVAVSTVVPEDLAHDSAAPFDPVVASGRRVAPMIEEMKQDILISGAQLLPASARPNPAVVLRDSENGILGIVTWKPKRPGLSLLRRAAPLVAGGVVVLILILVLGALRVTSLIQTLEHSENELDGALRTAESANRAKTLFLANMSHELRTPLNGVIAVGQLLRARQVTEETRDMASLIVSSGHVLERLIGDVLDVSKIEAGQMVLESVAFDPRATLAGVAELHAAACAPGVRLAWRVAPNVPARLMGDPTRITQIISNLLGNAVKFTQAGEIRLTARWISGELHIVVGDTGIGFDNAQTDRLFEPFEQADPSVTRRHGGTGLGLAISAALVQAMEGRIRARSVLGQGSVFVVRLPVAATTEATGDGEAAKLEAAPEPVVQGEAPRVLLAEDHPTNQRVVALILEAIGVDLTIVENGLDAVQAASKTTFDLILMDVQMPEMDGLTATRLIREREQAAGGRRTPVICLTANVREIDRHACLEAGADQHLAKPVRPDALIQAVVASLSGPAIEAA